MKHAILVIILAITLSGCFSDLGGSRGGSKEEGVFVTGKIVEDFPKVPVYPGAKIIESFKSEGKFGASIVVSDDLEKVVNFYKPALAQLGWEASLKQRSSSNFVYEIKNSELFGEIIVNTTTSGEKTAITVSVEPR